jgi:hypothetical protein
MNSSTPASLLDAFGRIADPRHRRGVRPPFDNLLALTFPGPLCRQTDFAAIARRARDHWSQLREPLGFTRRYDPHSTTLTRAAAGYMVQEGRKI